MQTLDWTFVLLFLAIRATAAVIAAVYTLCTRGDLGDFAVHYLAPTWIDVITFGIPVLTAMFGPKVGQHYPVLAAFSSFIFELPVILVAFQVYTARRELGARRADGEPVNAASDDDARMAEPLIVETGEGAGAAAPARAQLPWGRILGNVGRRLLCTPPLVAMVLGLVWGSIGWKLPDVLATVLTTLGSCVTPVATFCVGIFITDGQPFARVWRKTVVYMLLKIVGMPLLAMALIAAFGLRAPVSEVALVIASLPLAFPAFTFAKEYGRGEDVMSTCIAAGTVLMLPVVVFWAFCANWVFGEKAVSSSSSL